MTQNQEGFTPKKDKLPALLKRSGNFVIEVIKIVVISLAVIIPIRYFLIQPFYVKGASMEPTFFDYEYLIINEINYRFNGPARGDVVVLKDPRNSSRYFIKRIIGLPEDRVVVKDGNVFIFNAQHPDGFVLDESAYLAPTVTTKGKVDVTLSKDQFFFMGDNRSASLDARILGPTPRKGIVGKVWIRAWPFSRVTNFSTPSYPANQ